MRAAFSYSVFELTRWRLNDGNIKVSASVRPARRVPLADRVKVDRTQSGRNMTFALIPALTLSGPAVGKSACAKSDKTRIGLLDDTSVTLLLLSLWSRISGVAIATNSYTAYV